MRRKTIVIATIVTISVFFYHILNISGLLNYTPIEAYNILLDVGRADNMLMQIINIGLMTTFLAIIVAIVAYEFDLKFKVPFKVMTTLSILAYLIVTAVLIHKVTTALGIKTEEEVLYLYAIGAWISIAISFGSNFIIREIGGPLCALFKHFREKNSSIN